MKALGWLVAAVLVLGGTGAAAVFVYSLAIDAPPAFSLDLPADRGPTDEEVGRLDPNAGLITTPLEPLQPMELAPLGDEQRLAGSASVKADMGDIWLLSGGFSDGGAAKELATALLKKGAPADRVAIIRREIAAGLVDWRVELGPLNHDQAVELQRLLGEQGLLFDAEW